MRCLGTLETLKSPQPISTLLRGAMLFLTADIFYTGFGSAYAYAHRGVQGVLIFLALSQLISTLAYVANVYRMQGHDRTALQGYRAGIAGMFASLLVASFLVRDLAVLGSLAFLGGAARGVAFSSRTWLELSHTRTAMRERYLGISEALGALLRLAGPLLSGALLFWLNDNFYVLFGAVGAAGLALVEPTFRAKLATAPPGKLQPVKTLLSKKFWSTSPFYIMDGAGHALRTALFVSGAMAIVGSAAGYSLVEALASFFAAGLLWWHAHRPAHQPSLARLRNSVVLLGFGWLCLMLALVQPLVLPVFVAAYAIGNPLVTMVKSGLTLKGLAAAGTAPQDNLIARMMLLTLGRFSALGLAFALTSWTVSARANIVVVAALALLLLPFEYYYARKLSRV